MPPDRLVVAVAAKSRGGVPFWTPQMAVARWWGRPVREVPLPEPEVLARRLAARPWQPPLFTMAGSA